MPVHRDKSSIKIKSEHVVFGLALFLLIVCYLPYLDGSKNFVILDCQLTYQPLCKFIGDSLRIGILPLWNPHSYCGFSQLAVTSPGLFYPLNLLLFLLPFSQGEAIYLILHQFFAGIATYFFVEKILQKKDAALFAALSIMFGGYMFAMYKFPDFVASICNLMFCFWTSANFFSEAGSKRKLHFAGFSISMLMLFLCGRPEIVLPGLLLLVIFSIVDLRRLHLEGAKKSTLFRLAAFWIMAISSAGLLAAPVILPAWEWARLSSRAHGLSADQVLHWSTCWYDWFSMVFWNPFGDLDLLRQPFGTIHSIMHSTIPFTTAPFMGSAFFTLLCFGFADRSSKYRNGLILAFLAGTLLCAGDQTPLAPLLLNTVPQLGVFRYPVKEVIFAILPAILLAAQGFAWVLDTSKAGRWLHISLSAWLLVLLLGPALYYAGSFENGIRIISIAFNSGVLPGESHQAALDLMNSFIQTGLWGIAFTALACLYKARTRQDNGSKLMPVAAMLLTLAIAPMLINGFELKDKGGSAEFYDQESRMDLFLHKWIPTNDTGNNRLAYIITEPLVIPGVYLTTLHESYSQAYSSFQRNILFPNNHISTLWNYSTGYALTETFQISDFTDSAIYQTVHNDTDFTLARFCALSGSSYVISPQQDFKAPLRELDDKLFSLVQSDPLINARLYKVKHPSQRFYFATNIAVIDSWNSLAENMCAGRNNTECGDRVTFLDQNEAKLLSAEAASQQNSPAAGSTLPFIKLASEDPNRIELLVQKTAPGLLVMRDQYYPGWTVRVDGAPQNLLRANIFNRAVFVHGGKHKVVFQFEPESLNWGIHLAACGMMLAALSFVLLHFVEKKDQRT